MRRGGVLTLLRGRGRHFKRKSTPQPTTPMARARPGRFSKMQPRSQSLGSLSVITDTRSPARYEPATNPIRLAASVHYLGEEIVLSAQPPALPRLRRTQCSMLCLGEDDPSVDPLQLPLPLPVALPAPPSSPLTATAITNTNNNHIYADLELANKPATAEENTDANTDVDANANADVDSVASENELQVSCHQIQIEINRIESDDSQAVPQSSIDAHLDQIDELNRVLDDRLKRSLQPMSPTDVNAIESADDVNVQRRQAELDADSQAKRCSSSSSECRSSLQGAKDAAQHKKRSLSFTQKSISNIISNIREFSKSPLARMGKSATLSEEPDPMKLANEPSQLSNSSESHTQHSNSNSNTNSNSNSNTNSNSVHNNNNNNNNAHPCPPTSIASSMATTLTTTSTSTSTSTSTTMPSKETSRLKFKVPKIQKKSKAIRNTFRTKLLSFQLSRSKPCKQCTKRRRIHPSKSVLDFAKEFETNPQEQAEQDQFCSCPKAKPKPLRMSCPKDRSFEIQSSEELDDVDDDGNEDSSSDDVLSLKEHCYCVPSLAASVSSSEPRSRSASRPSRLQHPQQYLNLNPNTHCQQRISLHIACRIPVVVLRR